MSDFGMSGEFVAYMVSLRRAHDAYLETFEVIRSRELPLAVEERRRRQFEDRILLRQLRSALACSAFSISEQAIIELAGREDVRIDDVREFVGLSKKDPVSAFCKACFRLANLNPDFKSDVWSARWAWFHGVKKLRDKLQHQGGVVSTSEFEKIVRKLTVKDPGCVSREPSLALDIWQEKMFPESSNDAKVIILGEMGFRELVSDLGRLVMDIDANLHRA